MSMNDLYFVMMMVCLLKLNFDDDDGGLDFTIILKIFGVLKWYEYCNKRL